MVRNEFFVRVCDLLTNEILRALSTIFYCDRYAPYILSHDLVEYVELHRISDQQCLNFFAHMPDCSSESHDSAGVPTFHPGTRSFTPVMGIPTEKG